LQDPSGDDSGFQPLSMDPSSFSNADKIATTNFYLDVTVDFDKSSIYGTNTLTFVAMVEGVSEIVLDYQGIDI
jgi:hypothetical protein